MPNSIVPLDSNGILIIRDYAENVKRMLEMINQVDVSVPEEYITEVIPIKYAMAEDIANALEQSRRQRWQHRRIGSAHGAPAHQWRGTQRSGCSSGPSGGQSQWCTIQLAGTANSRSHNANGTPSSGNVVQVGCEQIISARIGPDGRRPGEIQVIGQTKIIADQRSNSLLVFATRQDYGHDQGIVAKLDVLLSQVLD